MSNDFPSSKLDRGKIFAKTGFKLGTNYAKRYIRKKTGKKETQKESQQFHTENAEEVFKEFTKLRGTALKIAQSLSMDQGLLPNEFADVMSQAQYRVPPINKALARSLIKKELGEYPETVFASFSSEAIAAASIGQVHQARLKNGEKVAVKIQYPNVRNTIESDLGLAKTLLRRFTKKGANLDEYFDDLHETLLEETDYIQEGNYLDHFQNRFDQDKIQTPVWQQDLSTRKVLTMSFLEGRHLNEFLQENPSQKRRNHFGQLLWDFFHDQVQQRDFIHADTHPGNFFFQEDGRLGVIDFGCVKKFSTEFTNLYMKLLPVHLNGEPDEIRQLYIDLDITRANPDDPEKEEQFFQYCKKYGNVFAEPYIENQFNFGKADFEEKLNYFAKELPIMNEPRGHKNFLYSTKVHIGLYNILMKLGAVIDTSRSKEIAFEVMENWEA